MPRPITNEEKKMMIELAAQGERAPAIAKAVGRDRGHVLRLLRAEGFVFTKNRTPMTNEQRFLARCQGTPVKGCWIWSGPVNSSSGYGMCSWYDAGLPHKFISAHVMSYRIYKGVVPQGAIVMHQCDNRLCVNPAHLELGTQKENMAHCIETRRVAHGERVGGALMTTEKVLELRARHSAGETGRSLSKAFGISEPTVSQIIRRRSWGHI